MPSLCRNLNLGPQATSSYSLAVAVASAGSSVGLGFVFVTMVTMHRFLACLCFAKNLEVIDSENNFHMP